MASIAIGITVLILGILILIGGFIWYFVVRSYNSKLPPDATPRSTTWSWVLVATGVVVAIIGGILLFMEARHKVPAIKEYLGTPTTITAKA